MKRPIQIIEGHPCNATFDRVRYYIDCPLDTSGSSQCERIEIPRALAAYIRALENEAAEAQFKLAKALEATK